MEHISFEAVVKDGQIEIPEKYPELDKKRVLVKVVTEETGMKKKTRE